LFAMAENVPLANTSTTGMPISQLTMADC